MLRPPWKYVVAGGSDTEFVAQIEFGASLKVRDIAVGDVRAVQEPIQSLVENAVKHGITPQSGGGEVLVTAAGDNGNLRQFPSQETLQRVILRLHSCLAIDRIWPDHCLTNRIDASVAIKGTNPYLSQAHSFPPVFIQKREHVGLPSAHAEIEQGVPLVGRVPDGRVDLQAVRLVELLKPRVQLFARREREVVGGVNEEDRRCDTGDGGKEPIS